MGNSEVELGVVDSIVAVVVVVVADRFVVAFDKHSVMVHKVIVSVDKASVIVTDVEAVEHYMVKVSVEDMEDFEVERYNQDQHIVVMMA